MPAEDLTRAERAAVESAMRSVFRLGWNTPSVTRDDLRQIGAEKLLRHRNKVPPGEDVAAWLFECARTGMVDQMRAGARHVGTAADPEEMADHLRVEELVHARGVLEFITRLPEPLPWVAELLIEGNTPIEISRAMGIRHRQAVAHVTTLRWELRALREGRPGNLPTRAWSARAMATQLLDDIIRIPGGARVA